MKSFRSFINMGGPCLHTFYIFFSCSGVMRTAEIQHKGIAIKSSYFRPSPRVSSNHISQNLFQLTIQLIFHHYIVLLSNRIGKFHTSYPTLHSPLSNSLHVGLAKASVYRWGRTKAMLPPVTVEASCCHHRPASRRPPPPGLPSPSRRWSVSARGRHGLLVVDGLEGGNDG